MTDVKSVVKPKTTTTTAAATYYIITVHRCGPGASMRACHATGPGSIPVGTSFLGEVFRGFSSPVRQMSGSFRHQGPPISFGHHYHHSLSSFITGANDLRCWRALKPQIYCTYTYIITTSVTNVILTKCRCESWTTDRNGKHVFLLYSHSNCIVLKK